MKRAVFLLVLLVLPSMAVAQTLFGGLWTPIKPPPPPPEVSQTLSGIRSQGCTSAIDPDANAFAETGFGRGEHSRDSLPLDVQSAITAI